MNILLMQQAKANIVTASISFPLAGEVTSTVAICAQRKQTRLSPRQSDKYYKYCYKACSFTCGV